MKKRYLYLIILTIILSILIVGLYSTVRAYKEKNLHNFAMSKKIVNIHIGEFKSTDKTMDIKTKDIIEAFKLRLKKRKTINFDIVENIEDADLSISGDIIRFMYLKKDPIDIIIPLGLVIDLATAKNYARLEYEIDVLDVKKNRSLWKKRLKATITEFNMPKEEAIPLIIDRAAYVFIKECFGRPEKREKI